MNIRQELEAAIRPNEYIILELESCHRDIHGRFIGVSQGFLKLGGQGFLMAETWIDVDDINCVMDDQYGVLWSREA